MKNLSLTLSLILFASASSHLFAGVPPPTPFILPIDQGLLLVVAMGAGYGAKHLYDNYKVRKADKEKEEDKNL
ncbi:MAG: hypothetical protein IT240_03860 [Bacteroidia bacterium]|jgi:hypothetical protein|nr:hypothetical protein [Bacteroidia bacterium]MCC6768156.1 hypothetical protein [Bacteroidia bacterium]